MTREFHERVFKFYVAKYGANSEQATASMQGFRFEPHVAEWIWEEWLRETGVRCVREEVILSAEKKGARLVALRTASGRRFAGKVFIDASYEGDLLALAGCAFHLGREARVLYGESLAGVTYPPEKTGEGDRKLQPFDFRCCLTKAAENRVPFTEPPDYDPASYAWLLHNLRRAEASSFIWRCRSIRCPT